MNCKIILPHGGYVFNEEVEKGFVIEINQLRFSGEIFEFLKDDANTGRKFRLLNKKDGVVTVEHVPE